MAMSLGKAEINVTPLIHVLLVLIIIFMVVLPQHSAGLPVVVPQPAPADAQPIPNDQDIIVNVNKDRSIAIKPATHRHLAFAGASPRDLCRPAEQKPAQELYEKVPAAGERWRIASKSKQLDLFADRTSTGKMCSNQLRLYFSSIVYVLLQTLRRTALGVAIRRLPQRHFIRSCALQISRSVVYRRSSLAPPNANRSWRMQG